MPPCRPYLMDLGSTNKTYINVSAESHLFLIVSLSWFRLNVCIIVNCLFFAFFRKILLNHSATMSFARKTPSSLVTAGMLLKNIANFRLLIMNNDRVCSLLNQYLLACILFWLTHCCLVSDFSLQCLDVFCSFGFSREYVLLHEGSAE